MTDKSAELTQTLVATSELDPSEAVRQLMPLVYDELRALAEKQLRSENAGHTLQPTALVHEVFMRLVEQSRVNWKGRAHFLAVSAQAMRRILVDHARTRGRVKRGGDRCRVMLDEQLAPPKLREVDSVALNDALETLATLDEQQARIVELRFFGGMSVAEVAHVLGVSKRKIEGDWTHAKAWLRAVLSHEAE
jgi:RNA polymerase sigma factor (TIGR02999 family)